MLALHAHHECVVSCLRLSRVPSARRIGCGDRSIERTQRRWPSRYEQVRFALPCLALLCLAGRRAQSARRTPALAEPKGCYAKRAARVRRKPIDALSAAARSRSRSHCLISERILCSQRSIGFVGVGDGTMGRRRSDLRASHAKPTRCVAPRRVSRPCVRTLHDGLIDQCSVHVSFLVRSPSWMRALRTLLTSSTRPGYALEAHH